MSTAESRDSNRFQLGRNANPQRVRYKTAIFNEFLGIAVCKAHTRRLCIADSHYYGMGTGERCRDDSGTFAAEGDAGA